MALEPFIVHRALASRLLADTSAGGLNHADLGLIGARTYLGVAKQGVTFPYIRHQPLSMLPSEELGPRRCGMEAVWLVAVVGKSERMQDLEAAVTRLDTLLEGWNGTSGATQMFWVADEWRWEFPVVDGVQYREAIGTWRVIAQAA